MSLAQGIGNVGEDIGQIPRILGHQFLGTDIDSEKRIKSLESEVEELKTLKQKHQSDNNDISYQIISNQSSLSFMNKEKNKKLLVKFIKENNNHSYNYWLENYSKNFLNSKNLSALKEVYLPRVFYYFYLESELKKNINTKKLLSS